MPTIVTFDKLLATLPDTDCTPYISDSRYVCVSKDWVVDEFSISWNTARLFFGLKSNVGDEASDCDDFALACKVHANRLHRLTQKRPDHTSLAFGVIWYTSQQGRHAVNVFWHAVGGKPIPAFYEPQLAKIGHLSEQAIATIRERLI